MSWKPEKGYEQRRNARFTVHGCVLVSLSHHVTNLGEVLNISLGGLAFRSVSGQPLPEISGTLDFFFDDCSFRINQLPFRTIWEDKHEIPPNGFMHVKRGGIRFGNLTEGQRSELRYLIQNHSTADPEG